MTKIYSKILCSKTNVYDGDLIEVKNKVLKSDKMKQIECKACTKIMFSHYACCGAKASTEEITEMPQQTLLFHLNDQILYDDKALQEYGRLYEDKVVLMVGTGAIKRTSVLNTLSKMKFKRKVNLLSKNSWTSEYFDDFIYAESDDVSKKEETLQAVRNYMSLHDVKFDAIFTYDEFCVLMTAYLTTELSLPGIPFAVASRIRNKYEFRKYCEELDIFHPDYSLIGSEQRSVQVARIEELLNRLSEDGHEEDANQMKSRLLHELSGVEPPFVMKNKYGLGKDFVRKCFTLDDYHKYLQQSIALSNKMDLLIEKFFEGHEIDIDLVVQNGEAVFMAVSDNFAPEETYFFERGGTTPSFTLSEDEVRLVKKLVSKWTKEFKIENACIHFEAICKPSSLAYEMNDEHGFMMPIELNLRIGGAEAWSMVNSAHGVNLFIEQINLSLGIPLNKEALMFKENNPKYYCISNDYHPAKECLIRSIDVNFKELQSDEDAVEACLFRASGDRLKVQDYMGWLTVKAPAGSSFEELSKKREKIMSYIKINLECS